MPHHEQAGFFVNSVRIPFVGFGPKTKTNHKTQWTGWKKYQIMEVGA